MQKQIVLMACVVILCFGSAHGAANEGPLLPKRVQEMVDTNCTPEVQHKVATCGRLTGYSVLTFISAMGCATMMGTASNYFKNGDVAPAFLSGGLLIPLGIGLCLGVKGVAKACNHSPYAQVPDHV